MEIPNRLLRDLLETRTAPFREKKVQAVAIAWLKAKKVPYCFDRHQNLIVGAKSLSAYRAQIRKGTLRAPTRVLIAHLDHPGFHVEKKNADGTLDCRFHGGSPTLGLEHTPVWLQNSTETAEWHAEILSTTLDSSGRSVEKLSVSAPQLASGKANSTLPQYGGFRFRAPAWADNEHYYASACDDLVGAWATLETVEKSRGAVMGLLTRAEEVGFIGTLAHLKDPIFKTAQKKLLIVSIETSRTLPQAEIGKGPIVRLGDRNTVFSPGHTRVLAQLAEKLLPGAHQKRVMDGGACEGSAAMAAGLTTIALSVPLGNYHNQNLQGGPDAAVENGAAPEFVHQKDAQGLLTLLRAVCDRKTRWDQPWKSTQVSLAKRLKDYSKLLRTK